MLVRRAGSSGPFLGEGLVCSSLAVLRRQSRVFLDVDGCPCWQMRFSSRCDILDRERSRRFWKRYLWRESRSLN
jgi:hypothetical protein